MKARKKKDTLSGFLAVMAVLCFILSAPAFAEMKTIDEKELARMNVSVTGEAVKDRNVAGEKGTARTETEQILGNYDKGAAASSQAWSKGSVLESIGLNLNISGQETLKFYMGGSSSIVTGGVTPAKKY